MAGDTAGAFLLCSCRAREAPPSLHCQCYGPDHQSESDESYEDAHYVSPAFGVVIARLRLMHHVDPPLLKNLRR
jgi:hypothetical protein